MAERSYPRDWTALLPAETARWVTQGIISGEQRDRLLKLYPEPVSGARDRTILILSILGSLLLGAGVILFFAANWPAIPPTVKVGMVLAAVLGSYGAGYHLQYVRGDYPRLGHSLILLGSLLYGAGIWLLAQIFHLNSHYPQGFLLWGTGLLPLVWVTRSSPVLYVSTLVMIIWTATEQIGFNSYNFLFPVLLLGAVLPLARRSRTALGEGMALLALYFWFLASLLGHPGLGDAAEMLMLAARVAVLYGAVLATAGLIGLGQERAYLSTGGALSLAGAYVLTFRWVAESAESLSPWAFFTGHPFLSAAVTLLVVLVLATGWLFWRRNDRDRLLLVPVLAVPVAAALGTGMLAVIPQMVTFNLLLFGGAVGLVTLGIQRQSEMLINIGLAAFFLHVLTRYFDLFFSAMNRSIFFMLGGLLLLGGGWLLERNRRRWMRDWGGADHAG